MAEWAGCGTGRRSGVAPAARICSVENGSPDPLPSRDPLNRKALNFEGSIPEVRCGGASLSFIFFIQRQGRPGQDPIVAEVDLQDRVAWALSRPAAAIKRRHKSIDGGNPDFDLNRAVGFLE
jgi:hypothetical protein